MSPGPSNETVARPDSDHARRRLFFALWPDDAGRTAILRGTRKLARQSGGRPVASDNVHLTLVFLGGVDADRVVDIQRIAAGVAAAPFAIIFDRLEYWQRARLLCLVPSSPPPALFDLVKDLSKGLEAAGFELDRRPFRAHLTIVRKVARPLEAASPTFLWPARDYVLVESRTGAGGSQYEVVGRWPLAAAAAAGGNDQRTGGSQTTGRSGPA